MAAKDINPLPADRAAGLLTGEQADLAAEPAPAPAPTESPARRRLRNQRGNLCLAGLFATGLALVYLLSLRAGPAMASAQQRATEDQVNSALDALGKVATGAAPAARKATEVVNTFYLEARQRQVAPEDLAGNPFVFQSPKAPVSEELAGKPATPPMDSELRKEISEAVAAVKKLELQSVVTGPRTTAMISNNLLAEGQTIQGWTIKTIAPREVTLTWKDQTYVLRMLQ